MVWTSRKAVLPRITRSFRPSLGLIDFRGNLEPRVSATGFFFWDTRFALGMTSVSAWAAYLPVNSTAIDQVSGGPPPAVGGGYSSIDNGGTIIQSIAGWTQAGPIIVDSVDVHDSAQVNTQANVPAATGGWQTIIVATEHMHTNQVTADALGPYTVDSFPNGSVSAINADVIPLHNINPSTGVYDPTTTMRFQFSINISSLEDATRLGRVYTLSFNWSGFYVGVGIGYRNSEGVEGLLITDTTTNNILYQDHSLWFGNVAAGFSYTFDSGTIPAPEFQEFNYQDNYWTWSTGVYNDETAVNFSAVDWTANVTLNV